MGIKIADTDTGEYNHYTGFPVYHGEARSRLGDLERSRFPSVHLFVEAQVGVYGRTTCAPTGGWMINANPCKFRSPTIWVHRNNNMGAPQ
ncbi:MAG: hypothetical protein RLP97_01585 [Coleofasciculus chthonoplastes F2-STO-03]